MHPHVLGVTHGFQHLWPEHPAIAYFDPAVQHRMESEDLQGGLRVWVVCRFESNLFDPHLAEEDSHEA